MPGRPGQWGLCRRHAPQAQVTPQETFQHTAWPPTAETRGDSLTDRGSLQRRIKESEAKKEISQAKEELLKAKAKLKELNAKLMELSEVMEKIEAAQGRLQKVEDKLFLESFSKKSSFDRIGN